MIMMDLIEFNQVVGADVKTPYGEFEQR